MITIDGGTGTILHNGVKFNKESEKMIDQWRLSDHVTLGTSEADVTTNWERNDSTGYEKIGTGMSESSGIFTFPQTGIYLIELVATAYGSSGASLFTTVRIKTRKNGGSYADRLQVSEQSYANIAYGSIAGSVVFDVEDVSGDNLKMAALAGTSGTKLLGSSTVQRTGLTFIRIGDT